MTDLDCWHEFEVERPNAFRAMYQFWVQKRAAGVGNRGRFSPPFIARGP